MLEFLKPTAKLSEVLLYLLLLLFHILFLVKLQYFHQIMTQELLNCSILLIASDARAAALVIWVLLHQ